MLEDQERVARRFSHEMHDELGQTLVGLKGLTKRIAGADERARGAVSPFSLSRNAAAVRLAQNVGLERVAATARRFWSFRINESFVSARYGRNLAFATHYGLRRDFKRRHANAAARCTYGPRRRWSRVFLRSQYPWRAPS